MKLVVSVCCLIYYVTSAVQEIPSIGRVIKRKSSSDYSLWGVWFSVISNVSWAAYIYSSNQTVLVYLGTLSDLVINMVYIFVVIKYHRRRGAVEDD